MHRSTPAALGQRIRRIERLWPRFAWDALGRSRWQAFDGVFWSPCIGASALIAVAYLEVLLGFGGTPLPGIGDLGTTPRRRIIVAGLLVFNAWLLDRVLRTRTPAALLPAFWLRWLRPLILAVPVLGLAALPVWRRLVDRRPRWAFPEQGASPPLRLDDPSSESRGMNRSIDLWILRQTQSLPALVIWIVVFQITPLFSLVSWLGLEGRNGGPLHTAAIAAAVGLHLVAAGAALVFAELKIRRLQITGGRAVAFRCMPLALLLPVAAGLPALAIVLLLAVERKEEHGVQHTLFEHQDFRRLSLGEGRTARLNEVIGSAERARRRFAWGRIVLLLPEAAIPTWLLGGTPFLAGVFLAPALAGCILFAAEAFERLAGRRLRFLPEAAPLVGATCVAASLAAGAGALVGALAAGRAGATVGLVFVVLGFSGLLLALLALMWSGLLSTFFGAPERPMTGKALLMGLSFVVMLLGAVLTRPDLGRGALDTLRPFCLLGLLSSPVVAVACRPWRFFRLRLADLENQELSGRRRFRLGIFALTLIVPWGGLAAPWWMQAGGRIGEVRAPGRLG